MGECLFKFNSIQPSVFLRFDSQGAVFLEGISVKGVTQVTTQPKLGEIQRKCQDMAEWDKYEEPLFTLLTALWETVCVCIHVCGCTVLYCTVLGVTHLSFFIFLDLDTFRQAAESGIDFSFL